MARIPDLRCLVAQLQQIAPAIIDQDGGNGIAKLQIGSC